MGTAIVTGATGFVGGQLCRRLIEDNWNVVGIGRSKKNVAECLRRSTNFTFVQHDLSTGTCCAEEIPENCEVFYHLAWSGLGESNATQSRLMDIGNYYSAFFAASLAQERLARRFVFAGSDYQLMRSYDPGVPRRAVRDSYGAAKQACSDICREILLDSDTLFASSLMGLVFGPGDFSNRSINTFIRALVDGRELKLMPYDYMVDMVYIDDVCGGLIALADSGLRQCEYHIGNLQVPCFGVFLERMREALGSVSTLSFGEYCSSTFIDYSAIDLDALERDTGYICDSDFGSAVRMTRDWLISCDKQLPTTR